MADFATALKARMIATAGIGNEVHWVNVPQGKALPYTRLQVISDPRRETLEGYDASRQTRVQADFFATRWGEARDMAERVIAALDAPAVFGGIRFGRISADGPRDLSDMERVNPMPGPFTYRASIDLLVEHSLA